MNSINLNEHIKEDNSNIFKYFIPNVMVMAL